MLSNLLLYAVYFTSPSVFVGLFFRTFYLPLPSVRICAFCFAQLHFILYYDHFGGAEQEALIISLQHPHLLNKRYA